MALPDSYSLKPGSIKDYFAAILKAEAPDRFTYRFLNDLEFTSTNDRVIIGILKELGFLDSDGVPQDRYHAFLDTSRSKHVLAEGVREAFSDLFNVNKTANNMDVEAVKNKLRTLYKGSKKDGLIARIASTFVALCAEADFTSAKERTEDRKPDEKEPDPKGKVQKDPARRPLSVSALQYHINIILPESRDQAVYDAIFRAMREHLS